MIETAQQRWMRRALVAEHKLFTIGLVNSTPADIYSDDEWLVRTLTHKDGRPVHIDQLNSARMRLQGLG